MEAILDDDDNLEILVTDDGSQTVRDKRRDTTYHSTHGAVTESQHVFIKTGLQHLIDSGPTSFQILEIGFGTGLNALLTYHASRELNLSVNYIGIEAAPLPHRIVKALDFAKYLDVEDNENFFEQIHAQHHFTNNRFSLEVILEKIEHTELPQGNTLVYFDAFGPTDQSELWEIDVLSKVVDSLAPNGILVTYCAQGQFKRNLKLLGCEVESLPGPPGKREIVRATWRPRKDN